MMLQPRNHAGTQGHHLMKTLLEAKLLFMRQYFYVIFDMKNLRNSSDDTGKDKWQLGNTTT